jgi:DNA-binding LacI/PurR family transcriptional regulator
MHKRLCKRYNGFRILMPMITLKEIAREAGVSPGSVSAVLSGKAKERRIAPETCARIEEIAAQMGYRHNALAQSLKTGKSNLVGIVGHSHPAHHVLRTRAAARCFIDGGYRVTMQDLAWRPEQEAQLLRELISLRVEGLYLESGAGEITAKDEAWHLLREQARRGLPMVRLDLAKELPLDVVTVDRAQGAYLATCHLLEAGHCRIAYAIDDYPTPFLQARLKGFRRALREWKIPSRNIAFLQPHLGGLGDWRAEHRAGQKCFQEMRALETRPTALLAANDFIAMGVIGAAMEAGLQIPGDLAVAGFTGYPEAELCAIPLTTVAYPFEEMARAAAQMLTERLGGTKEKPRTLMLSPELVVRASCGARAANENFESLASAPDKLARREPAAT